MKRIDTAILRAIDSGIAEGLDIHQWLHQERFWFVDGRMYPALRRLERDGFTVRHESGLVPERGNRPRYWYTLTEKGREAL